MTAADLLTTLVAHGCAPSVDGHELVLAAPPPTGLEVAVSLLQCPLRGLLTGKKVYAVDKDARPLGDGGVIDPRELLPANVHMVVVESGGEWDRISPFARETLPHLFAPAEAKPAKKPSHFKTERAR
ncbi:hypothetical protein [Limnoglobus roseus]|uniref:Uncharacterized protein n=1 Tax=Limnoglobus roseus TaxID=2598579 RepID=A0A5C1AIY1_9BACT|nr:hypothetical protein [Limnoglobus roseus]QEL18615.1 hypothetical protein PX52LOC_05648 [Limnoglobus roseus]